MALLFEVKVVPCSGKNKWIFDKAGMLKCYLKNPPERGLANKELIKLLAKALGIVQADIQIVSGETSRKKRIKIEADISLGKLFESLGVDKQQSLFQ